jgi:hypothetical protein
LSQLDQGLYQPAIHQDHQHHSLQCVCVRVRACVCVRACVTKAIN